MKSRYLVACAIAAAVAAWSVDARAQRGAPQPETATSKAAQDLIAKAMAIAEDDLKVEATDACLPGGPAREPDRRPMQRVEPLKVFDNLKEMPEMVFNSHPLTMNDGLAKMAEIRKNPNGPNPYVLGKAKTARYLDIMLACRQAWVVEKDPSAL